MAIGNLCSAGDSDESVLETAGGEKISYKKLPCLLPTGSPPATGQKREHLAGPASQYQRGHSSPSLTLTHTLALCLSPFSLLLLQLCPSFCPQVGVEFPLIRVNSVSGDPTWQVGNKPGIGNSGKSVVPEVLWQRDVQRAASAADVGISVGVRPSAP